jgi:hypothetical protein
VQVPHGGQAAVEGTLEPAEAVVHGADAVQADADVVEAGPCHAVGHRRVDQGAVGGQADVEAHGLGAVGNVEQVRPQQRLAAGEDEHRHAGGLEVVHDAEDLGGAELAAVLMVGREGVAMFAGEVAAADEVPDDDRPRQHCAAPRRQCGVAAAALGGGEVAQVVGDAEHGECLRSSQPAWPSRRPVFFRISLE